jgi:hypothetical protein
MVLKYSVEGLPYREPPYTKAEMLEMEKHMYGPPIAIYGHRPDRPAPVSQPEPAKAEPKRKPRRAPKRP